MDSRCMKLAALGRPLYPGTLYDCRTDSLIPGITLWDRTTLHDDLDVHDQTKTFVKFAASDTLSEKANLLDVKASLKASFLGGLVEVEGSAKFMYDTKSSARQCRVTMQYSQTTKFEQLTMKELGNITYPQVFDQKTATHVVTAVLYGAHAFMVFDYTSKENESKQAIEGNLHAVVKKFPNLSIEGEASLKMTEEEKILAENTSLTFYGDYKLDKNPTTYMEALEVYKTLPNLMDEGKNDGVPLTVWLYPLTLLDDKAAKLVKEINSSLVEKTEKLLEELEEVERQCNDLNKNQTMDKFPDVKVRLVKLQNLQGCYKISFQNALARVLPAIRSGAKEDKALGNILNFHLRSPFTANSINKWVDDITTELNILSFYTSGLKDLAVVKSPGSLNSILFDPDVDVVVCLSFTSLKYEDSYLVFIEDFLNKFTSMEQTNVKDNSLQATQHWFNSPDISGRMKENLSLFTSFSKANSNEKSIKFIIGSIPDPSNPGNSIQLYRNGSLTDPKFQPVSKPPPPVVETSNERVLLKLSKPPTGKTVQFRVEYRITLPTNSPTDDVAWKVTDTSDAQPSFTLTQINEAGQYYVRYRAVSDVGVSEASDSVAFTFQEKEKLNPGIIRSKIYFMHSDDPQPDSSTRKSYLGSIPGGLSPGMALFFQGVVTSDCDTFAINLQIDLKDPADIAFHFSPRMKSVVLNSRRKGKWDNEEIPNGCPFAKGGAFDIIMVIKQECYEVIVNGLEYCTFKHRMPVEKVTAVAVKEDVCMNIVHIIKVEGGKLKVTDPDRI